MNPKKLKTIIKNAKTKAFDSNIEAFTLFHILANIGGDFGLIIRHKIQEYGDIDQVSNNEAYNFIKWLPSNLYEDLVRLSKDGLVKSSFITNNKRNRYTHHYHIVCCATKRTRILTIVRNWVKTKQGKKWIKNNEHRKDSITDFHFV
jgi:hypothetical protein